MILLNNAEHASPPLEVVLHHNDFSSYLFWDTDRSRIDFEKNKSWVIGRVLSHGMLSDWEKIKTCYGKETIRTVVLNLRYLDKRSLHFCAAYFGVPIEQFRCYNYAVSNPGHWDY
jgi:hypothetical protein